MPQQELGGGPSRELDQLAEALARLLGLPIALISTFDDPWQRFAGAHGLPPELQAARATRICNPLCQRVMRSGRPVIVHDAARRTDAGLVALHVVAYAGFPVHGEDGEVIGVIAAIDPNVHRWIDRDIATMRAFAASAGALLSRRKDRLRSRDLQAALAREIADRALLVRVAHAIRSPSSGQQAIVDALGELGRHLGITASDVIAIERDRVVPLGGVPGGAWDAADDPLATEAGLTRQPVCGPITTADGPRIGVVVPFPGDGKLVLLRLVLPETGVTGVRAAELASGVAALLAVVVERDLADGLHVRRNAELEIISIHDELTGLLNRRGFHAVAEGQLALARRKSFPGLVLFLDLDGLKSINDQAGHAAGDALLCDAARALRTTFRGADTIGRLGGDEFVVFSVATSEPDLAGIMARLAAEVARINGERDAALPLEWSIGFVVFDATNSAPLPVLLAEADRRMYEAKNRHRTQPAA